MKPTCLIVLGFLAFGGGLAGCSDATPTFADAAPGTDGALDLDAGPDAAGGPDGGGDPDGPPATDVTVHVTSQRGDGQPDVGAAVYFADADGAIVATRTVDLSGVVTALASPGGSVTVRPGGASVSFISTVASIEGGDELWFGRAVVTGGGQMSVTFPADPGTFRYLVRGPCLSSAASDQTTVTVFLTPGCASTRPLIVASDRDDGTFRYLVKLDAVPADGATLALTGPWLDPDPAAARATVANLPAGAILLGLRAGFTAGAQLLGPGLIMGDDEDEPGVYAFPGPPGLDGGVTVSLYHVDGDDRMTVTRHVEPIPATPIVVDATPAIAAITDVAMTGNVITWTRGAGAADAMVFMASDSDPKGGGDGVEWLFFASPDAERLALPAIPAPPPFHFDSALVLDVDVVDGNRAFRQRAGLGEWTYDLPVPMPAAYVQRARHLAAP